MWRIRKKITVWHVKYSKNLLFGMWRIRKIYCVACEGLEKNYSVACDGLGKKILCGMWRIRKIYCMAGEGLEKLSVWHVKD